MSSYDYSHSGRRSRHREDEQARQRASERETRRAERMERQSSRSVGADSLSMPAARALGLVGRDMRRPHGRGQTALRVEQTRAEYLSSGFGAGADAGARSNSASRANAATRASVSARPAVYTKEPTSLRDRLHLPALSLSEFSVSTTLVIVAFLAISVALLYGPARTYYAAWREAGALEATYEVVAEQNAELNHELERLQSLEGIEDEARSRGYVYPGEEALVVTGVEEPPVADPALVDKAIRAHEQSLPWYVGLLDTVFGYQAT